ALFTSSNRVDYVFSFDARVEGLAEGVTSANLEMQVQLFNSEQTPDKILQVNLPFTAGSNWVHVTRNLEDGALGDGTSDERFAGGYRNVTTIQYNVNSHDPHTAFGFDWDNA